MGATAKVPIQTPVTPPPQWIEDPPRRPSPPGPPESLDLREIVDRDLPLDTSMRQKASIVEAGGIASLDRAPDVPVKLDSVSLGQVLRRISNPGAKSAADWGVPDFVRVAAASYTEQPDAGHAMMLEAPSAFCDIVVSILEGGACHR